MFLSDISIKRPIMISMVLIVFVLFGALAYFGMNLELTPPVDFPMITVQTIYGGAGPGELELQVSKKIEDAVASIAGIDYIQSYSMENVSVVMVIFNLDKDVYLALQEVKDKVDGLARSLPAGADPPVIQRFDPMVLPVVNLVLSGPVDLTGLTDAAERELAPVLAQIPGVADVQITGAQKREIRVAFDSRVLLQRHISLMQTAQVLAAQNIDMPGGSFRREAREYSVRLEGTFSDADAIRDLTIPAGPGMSRLGDIARVTDSGEDVRERTIYYNSQSGIRDGNVIQLALMKTSDGNPVNIYRDLSRRMDSITRLLPAGCSLHIVNQNASFVEAAVNNTLNNIIMGVVLTSLVLFFFLHDYRSTIIVALSMPFSIISTFLFMDLAGFSLNLLSLMGLSTAVGILVANSVVVLENIFRHKSMGHSNADSASKGTAEVAVAVIASTLTNLVVFLPLGTMSSIAGRMFEQFSLTVVFATIFSLITAFTLTPMLAARILPEKDTKKHFVGRKLEIMFRTWERVYGSMLRRLLLNKKRGGAVLGISVLLLVISLLIAGTLGFEFIPAMDEGFIGVEVELPPGSSLDAAAGTLRSLEEKITGYDEVAHYWIEMGRLGDTDVGVNLAALKIKLRDPGLRRRSTREIIAAMTVDFSDVPNARISIEALTSFLAGRADAELYLRGPDGQVLQSLGKELASRMKTIPGLVNLSTSAKPGKPEVTVLPRREALTQAGLTMYDLAITLRSSLDGIVTTALKEEGDEYDIRVMTADDDVDSPQKIGAIPVSGRAGTSRLDQLADITFTEGYSTIFHFDRLTSIRFECDAGQGYVVGDIVAAIEAAVDEIDMPPGYGLQWGGMTEQMQKTTRDIAGAFAIAILLTYMLLAAILESLTQPLLILATVPLALIGVFSALALSGLSMNIISMLAIVMLIGIVVNNAILLLDYTNQLVRREGLSVRSALITACPTKLKPILMSNIAIILGMVPMAAGIGASGTELRQPMGVVAIGGLLVSTLLTLVVIPVLYHVVSRRQAAGEMKKEGR